MPRYPRAAHQPASPDALTADHIPDIPLPHGEETRGAFRKCFEGLEHTASPECDYFAVLLVLFAAVLRIWGCRA